MHTDIVICGVGGQGVITAGRMISTAALLSGRKVVMSEIHGLAQRGGSVSVDVRIGDILGPIIPDGEADIVIAMEPLEGMRNLNRASDDAVFILNTQRMPPVSLGIQHMEYPELEKIIGEVGSFHTTIVVDAASIAEKTGEPRSVSAVMVGAASALKNIQVPVDDFFNAIRNIFPPKLQEANIRAFREGRELSLRSLREAGNPVK